MAKKFYELTVKKRIEKLFEEKKIDLNEKDFLVKTIDDNNSVTSLSENVVGTVSIPFSVIYPFKVNGKDYVVPMSTEEPSVVAAASNIANRTIENGFKSIIDEKFVVGQIVWQTNQLISDNINDEIESIERIIKETKPSLIKRGGGLVSHQINTYEDFVELLLYIDTVDAMGANIVNSLCEKIAAYLDDKLEITHLIAILSNDGSRQLVTSKVEIDFDQLKTREISGATVAEKISALSEFTQLSPYRAVTNNKGILNGIFAVLSATGNDTRAISAAVQIYLKNKNSLSTWYIKDKKLIGELTMPMTIGSVGGAISSLKTSQIAMKLIGIKDVKEFAKVVASVGLANNLAAMRALVTTGIQSGHMKLQSKSLAISAGAITEEEIVTVSSELNKQEKYDLKTAKNILENLRGK
ncbi:hydroxymethylglutaryl-CoA reductase, degradative [Companilactobacillus sp. DQM5]|uniref:hydroxymethylglutaryl-CoA reductase, degradative n=1 Tax=Companilactobacillus sp. DQM5 TaxID=3463359 RepID=UPI00405A4004